MADRSNRIYKMTYESVYPLLLAKVERKGRSQAELDEIIRWLTGVAEPSKLTGSYEELASTLQINPKASEIKGVICGVRVEEITDSTIRFARQLDKIVDELAKGKAIEKIERL
ncbi:DUF2200 family protein [Lactovum odontotermitis]